MPQDVAVSGQISLTGLMSVDLTQNFQIEAHDFAGPLNVPGSGTTGPTTDMEVEIGGGTQPVTLFYILMTGADDKITVDVNVATPTTTATFELEKNKPLLLTGLTVADLLGAEPTKLFLSNAGVLDAAVTILIGRDATP